MFKCHNLHYEKFRDETVKCIEDEIPFEVPEGWEWCRLQNLFFVCSAKRVLQADWKEEGIPFYRAREIVKLSEQGFVDNELFISQDHFLTLKQTYGVPNAGDIMLSAVGTIGKSYIVQDSDTFYYKDASVICLQKINTDINSEYIRLVLEAPYMQKIMSANSNGTTVDTITISTANQYYVAVPPVSEQKRIVAASKYMFQEEITIEKSKDELLYLISSAKAKILDLAIRGELVPQNISDEPASALLARIRAEKETLIKECKLKRDKKESFIYKGDDNSYYEKFDDGNAVNIDEYLPFDIPETWCWSRLSSLCNKEIKRGKAPKYIESSNTLVFAQKCNLKKGGIDYTLAQYLDESTLAKYDDSEFIRSGDTIINSTGTGTLGRVGYIDSLSEYRIVPDSHVTVIRASEEMDPFYIFVVLKSFQHILEKSGEGSTNQKELKPNTLQDILVPVPPVEEQKDICRAVRESLSFVNNIEDSIN